MSLLYLRRQQLNLKESREAFMLYCFIVEKIRSDKVKETLAKQGITVTETCACIKNKRMTACIRPGNCPNGVYLSVPDEHTLTLFETARGTKVI